MQTFKTLDRLGDVWVRVNKTVARRKFESLNDVCVCVAGKKPFISNDRKIISKLHDARIPFDSHIHDYALQVCRQESNEYPAYFVRE